MRNGLMGLFATPVWLVPRLDATGWAIAVCAVLAVSTGLGVVYHSHHNRGLYTELSQQQRDKNQLQMVWGQYLLEIRTLAALNRVERQAQDELGMEAPAINNIVLVEER